MNLTKNHIKTLISVSMFLTIFNAYSMKRLSDPDYWQNVTSSDPLLPFDEQDYVQRILTKRLALRDEKHPHISANSEQAHLLSQRHMSAPTKLPQADEGRYPLADISAVAVFGGDIMEVPHYETLALVYKLYNQPELYHMTAHRFDAAVILKCADGSTKRIPFSATTTGNLIFICKYCLGHFYHYEDWLDHSSSAHTTVPADLELSSTTHLIVECQLCRQKFSTVGFADHVATQH